MRKIIGIVPLLSFVCTGFARSAAAQNLVIKNVRIIEGNGTVIDRGSIIIRGGKIASVSAGDTNASGMKAIDARG